MAVVEKVDFGNHNIWLVAEQREDSRHTSCSSRNRHVYLLSMLFQKRLELLTISSIRDGEHTHVATQSNTQQRRPARIPDFDVLAERSDGSLSVPPHLQYLIEYFIEVRAERCELRSLALSNHVQLGLAMVDARLLILELLLETNALRLGLTLLGQQTVTVSLEFRDLSFGLPALFDRIVQLASRLLALAMTQILELLGFILNLLL